LKEWHYFTNEIETEKGKLIVVNVRDKGKKQYIYKIATNKKSL
jgi:hypothetical protein